MKSLGLQEVLSMRKFTKQIGFVVMSVPWLVVTPPVSAQGGGNVLPPQAQPHSYTLTDMAEAVALFTRSGNNLRYYPNTPFQVLFVDRATRQFNQPITGPGGSVVLGTIGVNSFQVPSGTPFYVPLFNSNTVPPVIGDFPTNQEEAAFYFESQLQLGGVYEIIIDGRRELLDGSYASAPVEVDLPPPLRPASGQTSIQVTTLGAFLTPLSVGSHTVTIRAYVGGQAFRMLRGCRIPPSSSPTW
jgi:hypothetical protein